MESKLGLYDTVARLVPGGFAIWAGGWMLSVVTSEPSLIAQVVQPVDAVVLLLLSYVVGLILHTLGKMVVEPVAFKLFPRKSTSLVAALHGEALSRTWLSAGLDESVDQDARCRALFRRAVALTSDDSKIQALQSQFGIQRTMAVASLLLAFSSATGWIWAKLPFWFCAGWFGLAILFIAGTSKWDETFVRAVIDAATVKALPRSST